MTVFVTGKKMLHAPADLHAKAREEGQFYTTERFYTLVNCLATEGVHRASKTMSVVMSFLFRSYNYKHDAYIYMRPSRWIKVIDAFCWLCVIGFVACLIAGVAAPLVSAIVTFAANPINGTAALQESFAQAFSTASSIAPLVLCVICFIVALTYLYILKNVVRANRGLSLQDYVCRKLSFIKRFRRWAHLDEKLKRAAKIDRVGEKIARKTHQFRPGVYAVLSDAQIMGSTDRWVAFQALDLLYGIFKDMGIVLQFSGVDEGGLRGMQKIVSTDFKETALTAVPDDGSILSLSADGENGLGRSAPRTGVEPKGLGAGAARTQASPAAGSARPASPGQ